MFILLELAAITLLLLGVPVLSIKIVLGGGGFGEASQSASFVRAIFARDRGVPVTWPFSVGLQTGMF